MKPKTILITGTSRGIGKAIALKLLEEGHKVVGIARSSTLEHPSFESFALDLSDLKSIGEKIPSLCQKYAFDALICNAGKGQFAHLEEFSFEQIRSLFDVNLLSHLYLVKLLLPNMKKRSQGHLIFIGSEAALQGKKKGTVYCATKFALRGFVQALRDECSASGVRVTLINPGMVETEFFKDLSFEPGKEPDEHIKAEDIANLISFLLHARVGSAFDEINLSPQKKKIIFKKGG